VIVLNSGPFVNEYTHGALRRVFDDRCWMPGNKRKNRETDTNLLSLPQAIPPNYHSPQFPFSRAHTVPLGQTVLQ